MIAALPNLKQPVRQTGRFTSGLGSACWAKFVRTISHRCSRCSASPDSCARREAPAFGQRRRLELEGLPFGCPQSSKHKLCEVPLILPVSRQKRDRFLSILMLEPPGTADIAITFGGRHKPPRSPTHGNQTGNPMSSVETLFSSSCPHLACKSFGMQQTV